MTRSAHPPASGLTTSMSDESAIRYFRQTHGPVMLSYLMGLTGQNAVLAGEIVEEALRRAQSDPEARAGGDRWSRAWLFAEAKRIVAERHAGPADGVGGPADLPQRALAALPADTVTVLIEVALKGRALPEVAAALGISPEAAGARFAEALRVLRQAVGAIQGDKHC